MIKRTVLRLSRWQRAVLQRGVCRSVAAKFGPWEIMYRMLACWDKLQKYPSHLLWQQFGLLLDRGGGRGFHSIAGQLALVPQLLNPLPPLQRLLLHVADIALLFRFCHLFRVIGDHRHWRTILPGQLKGIEVDSVDEIQQKQINTPLHHSQCT